MAGPARPTLARLAGALAYQQLLLGDARRNRAFARAIRARVRKGASVLDLGSGSGVWAVLAARLGARRVVAVEREAVLVPVIEAFAREAGVADRVRVVRGEAARVRLRREFDVVIGELVGNEGFEEGLLPVFERARDRFLRRGGALVPEWLALVAAPARVPVALGITPPILPARRVASLTTHAPRSLHPAELRTLAPGRELFRIDLRTARARDRLPTARSALPGEGCLRRLRHRRLGADGSRAGCRPRNALRDALAAHAAADREAAEGARSPRGARSTGRPRGAAGRSASRTRAARSRRSATRRSSPGASCGRRSHVVDRPKLRGIGSFPP